MYKTVAPEWLRDRKIVIKLPNDRRRVQFLGNLSGYALTPEFIAAAESINREIKFLDPNLTDIIKPCDVFPIQNNKEEWIARFEKHKMSKII